MQITATLKTKIARDVMALIFRGVAIRAVSVPTSIYAARLLGPELFGVLGILNQITLIARVSGLGYDAAAIRDVAGNRGGESSKSKATAYTLDMITSLILTAGVLAASFAVEDPRFIWGLRIIAAVLLVTHYNRLSIANAKLDKRYRLIALAQMFEQVINSAFILATVITWGIYGPLLAGIPAALAVIFVLRRYRPVFTLRISAREVVRQTKTAVPMAAGLIIPVAFDGVERLLVAQLYGLNDLGAYLIAGTFISLGLMVATALMEAIGVDIYERIGHNGHGGKLARMATTGLTFGGPLLGLGIIALGPFAVISALPDYTAAIPLLPWAAAILVIRSFPMVRLFEMTALQENRQARHAWYWALALVVFIVVTLALWASGVGLMAAMAGKLAAFVVLAGVSLYKGKAS